MSVKYEVRNLLFDDVAMERGQFMVNRQIPWVPAGGAGSECVTPDSEPFPLEFGHSLDDLLGGQLSAGFIITDLGIHLPQGTIGGQARLLRRTGQPFPYTLFPSYSLFAILFLLVHGVRHPHSQRPYRPCA